MMRSLDFILNLPVTGWGDGAHVCPALPPRPQVATCMTLGRPSPPVQVLGDVVVFTRKWQAGTQDTALSRPDLNSWVCDKRQVHCLNLAAQTFHRSTLYPPRNETHAPRDVRGISAFTKLTKGFKKGFLSVQSRLSLVLSASRDERGRKGKPREEDGEQWLPVEFQDRIECQRQEEGRRGR